MTLILPLLNGHTEPIIGPERSLHATTALTQGYKPELLGCIIRTEKAKLTFIECRCRRPEEARVAEHAATAYLAMRPGAFDRPVRTAAVWYRLTVRIGQSYRAITGGTGSTEMGGDFLYRFAGKRLVPPAISDPSGNTPGEFEAEVLKCVNYLLQQRLTWCGIWKGMCRVYRRLDEGQCGAAARVLPTTDWANLSLQNWTR